MAEPTLSFSDRQSYRIWLIRQSAVSLLLLVIIWIVHPEHTLLIVAGWAIVQHAVFVGRLRAWQTAADMVTLGRFLLTIAALGVAWWDEQASGVVLFLMALAVIGDWVDGWVARFTQSSPHGALLDLETDQVLTFALAISAIELSGMGWWFLLFPAYRYVYVLALEWLGVPADNSKPQPHGNQRGRLICAATLLALLMALSGWPSSTVGSFVSGVALLALTCSFAADFRYQVSAKPLHTGQREA